MSRLTADNDSLISAFSDLLEEKRINTILTLEEKAEKSKRLAKATIPTQEAELHGTSLMNEGCFGILASSQASDTCEASKAFGYHHHLLDKRIKKIDKTSCRACINSETGKPECLACHIDGNFKLSKHLIENESKERSYFGNEIICDDSELNEIMEEVNRVKPRVQKHKGMCGNSEFKAAQEVSSQRKNLDVAGNMMGSCGHATIQQPVSVRM
ncbi:hypothetical protein OUZ56_015992 [Daphnia magna]|uniref:Uncharacterized protein n=1 Tax=Daphnia magna TaxID=35525 RepID=A0ABR0APC3_9CRUS|nr:hypothetical protein OUZ56_015992 [Daphnia magna]